MTRKGSIAQLEDLLERTDNVMTEMILETRVAKAEKLLERYHVLYEKLEGWVERNPDFKSYRGYIDMNDDYKYIINSIIKPIDIDNYEDEMYW